MTVLYELNDQIAHVTLNRPETRNAFNRQLFTDLDEAMFRFRDDPDARVCVMDAAGPAFSVGFDIKDGDEAMERGERRLDGRAFASAYLGDDMAGKPVIVAIHGHCVGQGVANALFGDVRIASPDVKFTLAEARVGISALALPQLLTDSLGASHARYMLLTGARLDSTWAMGSGLIHEVVERHELTPRAFELAHLMLAQAPLAIAAHKTILAMALTESRDEVARAAKRFRAETSASEDFREGRRAFIERREPEWKGR